jgi:hypothetical protein
MEKRLRKREAQPLFYRSPKKKRRKDYEKVIRTRYGPLHGSVPGCLRRSRCKG